MLVPVDGSQGDEHVMSLVAEMVHQHQVSITLIYVVEVQQSMPLDAELPQEIDRGEAILHRAESFARSRPHHKLTMVTTDLLQARSAGAAIVDEAIERQADAIVLSAANRTIHGKITMGDTVNYVLKNAPCEVIVVRTAQHG
ncbi:MAG: universal stress protein [Thermomicrobiales bacterium]|nr:universal stress protein [Thermomicrobiales bacterium]